VGVAVYFLMGGSSEERPNVTVAGLSPPQTLPSPPASPEEKEKPPKDRTKSEDDSKPSPPSASPPPPSPPEAAKPRGPTVKISAARLAAELATDGDQARKKYENRLLQVSGLFDRWADPKSARGLFAVEGPVISFVLPKLLLARQAREEIQKNRPVTVKGRFSGDGSLQEAEILPVSPPADDLYLGREMEISGHVVAVVPISEKSEYPTLLLERDTDSRVGIDCLFPKSEEAELKKLMLGSFVTISTTCSGRAWRGKDDFYVRFDNCRLVYTTAPASSHILRFPVTQVLRDYEEDLRTALPATADFDPNRRTVTAEQLAKEFNQDCKSFDKTYRNKIIIVSGRLYRKGDRNVTLDTGQTNSPLKIQCFFTKQAFRQLNDSQNLTIRGMCSGMSNGQNLRLDNCESFDSAAKGDQPRLTADFLPCKPGPALVYELATLPVESKGPPLAFRKVFTWIEGGIMERTTTHVGRLPKGSNLTDPDTFKDWMTAKTTKKYSQAEPACHCRIYGGFVELGQEFIAADGQKSIAWEPVLKLGTKKGESWEWTRQATKHQCKLVEFQEQKNRASAIVKEAIANLKRPDVYVEVRHVYVKDVGEVEREEAVRLPSGQMKIVSRMRLVEEGKAHVLETPKQNTDRRVSGE
jgi:hypothetical protein